MLYLVFLRFVFRDLHSAIYKEKVWIMNLFFPSPPHPLNPLSSLLPRLLDPSFRSSESIPPPLMSRPPTDHQDHEFGAENRPQVHPLRRCPSQLCVGSQYALFPGALALGELLPILGSPVPTVDTLIRVLTLSFPIQGYQSLRNHTVTGPVVDKSSKVKAAAAAAVGGGSGSQGLSARRRHQSGQGPARTKSPIHGPENTRASRLHILVCLHARLPRACSRARTKSRASNSAPARDSGLTRCLFGAPAGLDLSHQPDGRVLQNVARPPEAPGKAANRLGVCEGVRKQDAAGGKGCRARQRRGS